MDFHDFHLFHGLGSRGREVRGGGYGGGLIPNNMKYLSPLSTQKLVSFYLEDFSDTMGDVIEGCDLNIGPSSAEAIHHGSPFCDLFLQQHLVAN